jgi:hypothetical protein
MEKNKTIGQDEQLLRAREEVLQNSDGISLRPMGKLWGMDVFTWVNPFPGMIANTIHSFPFEVIWMGNESDVLLTLGEDHTLCANLHSVMIYDRPEFSLKGTLACSIGNYICTASVADALEMLKTVKESRKVLLFTVSGPRQVEDRATFEEFVKLVQVK